MNEAEKILEKTMPVMRRAGDIIMSYYGKTYNQSDKGNGSPVTDADMASDRVIAGGLREFGYGLLSEEGADDRARLKSARVWIVDPLDGTKDFIARTGEFTVMAGLVERGPDMLYRPLLGLIYVPAEETFYYAIRGQGAYRKKEDSIINVRLQASGNDHGPEAAMLTSRFHSTGLERLLAEKLRIDKILGCGSSLKICRIAEGGGELNVNPSPHTWEWDLCAADIILREAGGKLTDTAGNEFTYNRADPQNRQGYVASNGIFHSKIIRLINRQKTASH